MSVNSRLHNIERSLRYRELALLWLKTSQERGGYADYWKIGEFQPWVSDNEDAGLIYNLAFEVNGAVMMATQGWSALAGWASLLGLAMIDTTSHSKPVGRTLSYIGSVLVKTIEVSDHEIRLRAMEKMLSSIKSGGTEE